MQLGKWYNIKYRQTLIDSSTLQLEGWINGQPLDDWIDTGTMTKETTKTDPIVKSGDKDALYYPMKNNKQVWTAGAYSGLYIRLTGTVKTFIKNLSVTEF